MPIFAAILVGATLLGASGAVYAQPRHDLIGRGRQLFDDQQYEESIQTLSAALLRPNNTREQKVEIFRVLSLDYITLRKMDEAESAVRGLLSLDPNYTLPATESPRFREVFTSIREKWEAEGRPGVAKEVEAPPPPVTMAHTSPAEIAPKRPIALTARLTDPGKRVTGVRFFYRTGTSGKFESLDATLAGNVASATIPANAVRPPVVEYYIEGLDAGGLPVLSRGDADAPLRVAVPAPSKPWLLPVAIGGGIAGAALIVGGLALAGVFSSGSEPGTGPSRNSTVSVTIRE